MPRPPSRAPASFLAVLSVLAALANAGLARGQAPSRVATLAELDAIASDGSRVHVGEITGEVELTPARRAPARFGVVRVRAGLEIEAVAGPAAQVPAYAVGSLGGVLEVAEDDRDVRVDALHRRGRDLVARLVLGDATLDDVPVLLAQVRVDGAWREAGSVGWRAASAAIREGATRLCASPGRGCLPLRARAPLPVDARETRGAWSHVVADAPGVGLDGWVPTRVLVTDAPASEWIDGRRGAISDGCPYEGRPALVRAGTRVSVRPDGPTWARIPDDPDSVWVHDALTGSPWVELTFARGVERSSPSSTCSTGWVPRASVTFDVLREGALTLERATEGEHEVVRVVAAPAWLLGAGLAPGDAIVARIERGQRHESADLDGMRRALGVGGTFRVLREGREREVRVPLAEGCEEPGAGQPIACRPR